MPTARFTVVSAPIEQTLAVSAARGWRSLFAFGKQAVDHVNATADGRVVAHTVRKALEPGSVAFLLAMATVALIIIRHLAIRIETKRILRAHREGEAGPSDPSSSGVEKTHQE